jgi:hypothetical protein
VNGLDSTTLCIVGLQFEAVRRRVEKRLGQRLHVDSGFALESRFADLVLASMAGFAQTDAPAIRRLRANPAIGAAANMRALNGGRGTAPGTSMASHKGTVRGTSFASVLSTAVPPDALWQVHAVAPHVLPERAYLIDWRVTP